VIQEGQAPTVNLFNKGKKCAKSYIGREGDGKRKVTRKRAN
jgi:hypothetical protein